MSALREHTGVVTRKGQVTIPAELRRSLGLEEGDHVVFTLENNEVRVVKRKSVANRTAGMFRVDHHPLSAEELREAAETAIGEEAAQRSDK
jgi:AbrB family looped-hinge helix DNA binding protein